MLSPRHGKAHVYRAILEGLALEQRLCTFGAEEVLGARTERFWLMGGGTHGALWCQVVADVLERPVEIAREPEATCLGAGMLAAAGSGLFDSIEEAASVTSVAGRSYRPDPGQSARYAALFEVYRSLCPALRDPFARLRDVMNELA